jgi:hypothetical protein
MRSRRSGAHWVPGLKTGTTLGLLTTSPPNRSPSGERPRGSPRATTSASAGSGHPTAPQTRKPRSSAVSEALCRTRTGDPFLTMAVRPAAATRAGSRKTHRYAETVIRQSSAPSRIDRHLRYPLSTRGRLTNGASTATRVDDERTAFAIGVGVFDGVTAAHGLVAAVLAARARRQARCRAHLELVAVIGALCGFRTRQRFRRGQDLPPVVPFEGISEHYPALRSVCHSALTQSGIVSSPSGPSVLRAGSRVRRRGRPARAGGCVRVRR